METNIDNILTILNHQLATDPDAIHDLLKCRVFCNDQLADDPFITCAIHGDSIYSISALSMINTIMNIIGEPLIHVVWDNNTNKIIKFDKNV